MRVDPQRLNNVVWEKFLGISTRGVVAVDNPDSVYYATMNYSRIRSVLSRLRLEASDVFVDVGSGKGRVLACAARYKIKSVVGVDLSPVLCQQAESNVRLVRGRRSPVTIKCMPAQEYDYSAASVLFLFNPFGASTLSTVLDTVHQQTSGRSLRIAYATPTHEAILAGQSWLERYDYWDNSDAKGLGTSVAFYRSIC